MVLAAGVCLITRLCVASAANQSGEGHAVKSRAARGRGRLGLQRYLESLSKVRELVGHHGWWGGPPCPPETMEPWSHWPVVQMDGGAGLRARRDKVRMG